MRNLHKGDESTRCFKIISVSRSGDKRYVPQLLALLSSDETYDNKRHIARALGQIGGPDVEDRLLTLLTDEQGLILGDVAEALGRLRCRRALPTLEQGLSTDKSEWVRQKAKWAIAQIGEG